MKLKSPDEHNHAPKKEVNKTSNNTPRSERWNSNKSPKSENVNNVTGSNSAVKSANSPETVKENTLPQTGEKETKASMFGLIALSVAGLLSVLVLDRKKKN